MRTIRDSAAVRKAFDQLPWPQEGFSGSSAGKESACNTGDPGSIPGLGGSPGEGTAYPLQYPWASLGGSDGECRLGSSLGPLHTCFRVTRVWICRLGSHVWTMGRDHVLP